jgi:hypothetical protein
MMLQTWLMLMLMLMARREKHVAEERREQREA